MIRIYTKYVVLIFTLISSIITFGQDHSVAREWNELHLNGIRNDFARPTITARNLWHVSAAMYDAWAVFDEESDNYFLGNTVAGFDIPFNGMTIPADAAALTAAKEEAVSYAAYRMLSHRYGNLPSTNEIAVLQAFDDLMVELGYDMNVTTLDYSTNDPAALGNYIADRIIAFGLQDGSFEDDGYDNQYYESIYNTPPWVPISQSEALVTNFPGNPTCKDPNRWQPLTLQVAIDQLGNPLPINTPQFLSPEWGNVVPFSLSQDDLEVKQRDGFDWKVYCDPGQPPHLDSINAENGLTDHYKWGNAMVVVWSSLLDHDDGNMIDISPNNIGNVPSYPSNFDDFDQFYDYFTGLDSSQGYTENPSTGVAYDTQMVPMGDYGRVLAEFWADGPDSETPPGHWFDILNYVSDHPDLEKKWNGQGSDLTDLEWDVKTYLAMGAAMHDCAIAAWGLKGYYDYVRPISAIRYMGDQGQSSDQTLPNYDNSGLPLIPNYIEIVEAGDPLVGDNDEHLNKIKVKSWKGPDYLDHLNLSNQIIDGVQDSTIAGVDWILSENWWPYQRPTFVSPPFAGYVSGHSTFSRAAAEVLEKMTGDAYFPGGMGVFPCPQNDFLVFEDGPSIDLELQWAKYTDASDQCSLSRIFGGIHPPADDLPGRIIGEKIGTTVFEMITEMANPQNPKVEFIALTTDTINEANSTNSFTIAATFNEEMEQTSTPSLSFSESVSTLTLTGGEWTDGLTYVWTFSSADVDETLLDLTVSITGGEDLEAFPLTDFTSDIVLDIDTDAPSVTALNTIISIVNEGTIGTETFSILASFDSEIDTLNIPSITFENLDVPNTLILNESASGFGDNQSYTFVFNVVDLDFELEEANYSINGVIDGFGNMTPVSELSDTFGIDTKIPEILSSTPNLTNVNEASVVNQFFIDVIINESADTTSTPLLVFTTPDVENSMVLNLTDSEWTNETTYRFVYDLTDLDAEIADIDFEVNGISDAALNTGLALSTEDSFSIDTKAPSVVSSSTNANTINEMSDGTNFIINTVFDEPMFDSPLAVAFTPSQPLSLGTPSQTWTETTDNEITFLISDLDEEQLNQMMLSGGQDLAGNSMTDFNLVQDLYVDNKAPEANITANIFDITETGAASFQIIAEFDTDVQTALEPIISFPIENPDVQLELNPTESGWDENTYTFNYDVNDLSPLGYIDIQLENVEDTLQNSAPDFIMPDFFSIMLDTFLVVGELKFDELKVYPNPSYAGEELRIEISQAHTFDLMLTDALGRKIDFSEAQILENEIIINTVNMPSGMYFMNLSKNGEHKAVRFEIVK